MAKKELEVQPNDPADVNPEVAFKAAWAKDQGIRMVLTKKGEIRGGLRPSEVVKAQEIRKSFGL